MPTEVRIKKNWRSRSASFVGLGGNRESGLVEVSGRTVALCNDLARIFVQCARLRDGLDGLLHLRVGFEKDLETFLGAVGGHKNFLFDLALHPILVFGE